MEKQKGRRVTKAMQWGAYTLKAGLPIRQGTVMGKNEVAALSNAKLKFKHLNDDTVHVNKL